MRIVLYVRNSYLESKIIEKYIEKDEVIVLNSYDEIKEVIKDKILSTVIINCNLDEDKCINLVTEIKEINEENRIILLLREMSKALKEKLFSKEVFNIIVGNKFELNEIFKSIENPKLVIYKNIKEEKNNKIFFICGIKKSGKSIVCKILGNELKKYKDKKVVIIDLDNVSPILDMYFKCTKNYALLDILGDAARNDFKNIICYESKKENKSNISYIINSRYFVIPEDDVIICMLKYLSLFYDFVIVDTSAFEINRMYRISNKMKANIILCIEDNSYTIRELSNNLSYINDEYIVNSIVIFSKYNIANNTFRKELIKKYKFKMYGKVYKSLNINKYIKYDIRKVIRYMKISRLDRIVLKILGKIEGEIKNGTC